MAEILSIALENFKGATAVKVDLSSRAKSPVTTLIGLNESGKTTILEGLSHFVTRDKAVSSLFQVSDTVELIPVHRKAAFTGEIAVIAEIGLDEQDLEAVVEAAEQFKLRIDKKSFPKRIAIERRYTFEDSVFKEAGSFWTMEFQVFGPKSKKPKEYKRPEADDEPDLWEEITTTISRRLPRIAYFPTFLVDMPPRIYLREHSGETPVNRFYRGVFQDILDKMGEGLSLEKHVCKRIADFKASEGNVNWLSIFFGGPSKAPIDSLFQKISSAVTKEVLGSWRKIFQRNISAKNISVEWHVDTEEGDLPYASFVVSDGESRYAISDRSLGFRWFFSFLLFTAFKQASKRKTLFVFDEPAANLHAKAQAELLESFARIVAAGDQIVYSTHSHHMINPRWLSGAYIVENTALDYDTDDAFGLSTKPTAVKATPYRQFVSQYPTRSSYFQPVIEKLEYVTPDIIGAAPYLIVEGISDYYALRLALTIKGKAKKFSIVPGVGANASGPLISLLLGRGERFLILLDADKEGIAAVERYKREWYLPPECLATLGDFDTKFVGKGLESLITAGTIDLVKKQAQISSEPTKKQIGLYFAEMCATGAGSEALDAATLLNLSGVLTQVAARFKGQSFH